MKKYIKVIISVLLCTSIFLSFCLIEYNTEHNCIGENCQVCRDIVLQREFLKSILLCLLCGGTAVSVSRITAFMSLFVDSTQRRLNLVANKIKLTA